MEFDKTKIVHVNSVLKTSYVFEERKSTTSYGTCSWNPVWEQIIQTNHTDTERERERERKRERDREREGPRERDRGRERASDPAQHTLLLGESLGTQRRKIHSAVTIVPSFFRSIFLDPLTPVES